MSLTHSSQCFVWSSLGDKAFKFLQGRDRIEKWLLQFDFFLSSALTILESSTLSLCLDPSLSISSFSCYRVCMNYHTIFRKPK